MKFLSNVLLKAGLIVEGTTDLQGTATAVTQALSDSSTKIATTAFVKGQGYSVGNIYSTDGSLSGNRTITLNGSYLDIAGTTKTRFFANGSVVVGSADPVDAGYKFDVNGTVRVSSFLTVGSDVASAAVIKGTSSDGSIFIGGSSMTTSIAALRNIIISTVGSYSTLTGINNTFYGRAAGLNVTSGASNVFIGSNAGAGITTGARNVFVASSDAGNLPSSLSYSIHLVAGNGYRSNDASSIPSATHTFIGGGFNTGFAVKDFYFGQMPFTADAGGGLVNIVFYAPSGLGTDIGGSNFTIAAGRGTGTGTPGDFIIRTSNTTTTGSTLQSLADRIRVAGGTGVVTIANLAGTGSRMVVADGSGVLSTQAIPSLSGYVPTSRTLTINGTSYDLSADRSWTIAAGVSSLASGTGISVSTVSGVATVTNTGLLSAASGTGISVSTSNQQITVTNTGLLSAASGTGISVTTANQQITVTNLGLLSAVSGTGISVSTSNQQITVTNTGILSIISGTGISASTVNGATTITNLITNTNQLTNGAGYITGINSSMVTSALGYTPYNAAGNTVLTNLNYTSYALRWNSTQAPANGLDNTSIVPNSVTLFDGYGAAVPGYPSGANQWWVGALTIGDANRGFQIAGGYADNDMYFRKGNSTWSAWRRVWTDANLTNLNQLTNGPGYLTSITSSQVTTALGYAPWNFGSIDAARNIVSGTNLDTDLENGGAYSSYGAGGTSWNAPFPYGGVIGFAFTSGIRAQFGFDIRHTASDYGDLWYRTKNNVGYSTWRTMLHSANYSSYALPLTGGTLSGPLTINTTGDIVANSETFRMKGGGGSGEFIWYRNYSGSPSHPGFVIINRTGTTTFSHNSNGGGTSVSGNFSAANFSGGSTIIGANGAANSYSAASVGKLYFGTSSADSPDYYNIATNMENFGGNYTKLDFAWYTGQRFYAHNGYGGFRFKEITGGQATLFSIGEGDLNVRVGNNLYIGSAGGWITDLLNAKQNASTAITTSNIGSQTVLGLNCQYQGNGTVNVGWGYSAVLRNETGSQGNIQYAPIFHVAASDTMWQITGDYFNSSTLRWRAGYSGSWYSWREILHSANFNSYSPTLTGGGASGTWSINVTGSAGSLSNMNISQFTNNSNYATQSWTSGFLHQGNGGAFANLDTNKDSNYVTFDQSSPGAAPAATWYNGFVSTHANYLSAYIINQHRSDAWYLGWRDGTTSLSSTWRLILHSSNYNSYSPTLTGGGASGTWNINVTGSAGSLSNMNISQFNNNSGYITSSGSASSAGTITGRQRGSFTVGGNVNTFYPVAFQIGSGATDNQGISVLQIERGGYDEPGYSNYTFSTFHARIRAKADGWGYGASYVQVEANAYTQPMMANVDQQNQTSQLIVWLRGGCSYRWMDIEGGWGLNFSNPSGGNYVTHSGSVTYTPTTTNTIGSNFKYQQGWGNNYISGTLTAGGDVVAFSDARVKENIRPIENVLDRVCKSRGVLYDRIDIEAKNNIGFIAQELEEEFPELVTTDEAGKKSVKYQNATAVLFEAIKEQQKQIKDLKSEVNALTK